MDSFLHLRMSYVTHFIFGKNSFSFIFNALDCLLVNMFSIALHNSSLLHRYGSQQYFQDGSVVFGEHVNYHDVSLLIRFERISKIEDGVLVLVNHVGGKPSLGQGLHCM